MLERDSVPDSLKSLNADIGEILRKLGLPVDARAFRPHLTLARRAKGAVVEKQAPAVHWKVEQYSLMSSALAANGAYTALTQYECFKHARPTQPDF